MQKTLFNTITKYFLPKVLHFIHVCLAKWLCWAHFEMCQFALSINSSANIFLTIKKTICCFKSFSICLLVPSVLNVKYPSFINLKLVSPSSGLCHTYHCQPALRLRLPSSKQKVVHRLPLCSPQKNVSCCRHCCFSKDECNQNYCAARSCSFFPLYWKNGSTFLYISDKAILILYSKICYLSLSIQKNRSFFFVQ